MQTIRLFLAAVLLLMITPVWAAPPFSPPGNLADTVATLQRDVAALKGRVTTLEGQVGTLQTALAAETNARIALQTRVSTIEGNSVLELDGLVRRVSGTFGPTALFEGVNVQIANGLSATNGVPGDPSADPGVTNGLGNLIVGYDELRSGDDPVVAHAGSHNLVIGEQHRYLNYGGFVGGYRNEISGQNASVLGGAVNTASGNKASVSGGVFGIASGNHASVSGGYTNTASGAGASVSGGAKNTASGEYSWASGGVSNKASGGWSSVSAGAANTASGERASVSGGSSNTASGDYSSVSGGEGNTASGKRASVSGGQNRSATGEYDWAAGSLWEDL